MPSPPPLGARPRGPRPSRAAALALTLLALSPSCLGNTDLVRGPAARDAVDPGLPTPAPLASGRLPGTARPLHYALALVVDPSKDRIEGDVTIDVDVPATTSAIVLHGRELTVLRAEASVAGEHVAASASVRSGAGGRGAPEELVLRLSRPIPAGRAQVRIAFSAPLGDRLSGMYRVRDGGADYAFTQLEPMDARRMFPCFDEPGYKVPFDVKVTTPKGNLVVANTPEVERTTSDDGKSETFTFATTSPLPTYLLGLAVGPLEIREETRSTVPLRLITTRGKSQLGDEVLETAAAMVELLAEYFDRPYPYAKLDLLAVPEFGFGAMENAGLIAFREDLVLFDPSSTSTQSRRAMAQAVAHEISHHWFGNLVTFQWWDDLWLNEGFATWMEARAVDLHRPAMAAHLETLSTRGWVMALDALDSARAVRQPVSSASEAEEAFDGITYVKGASVLGMLESWIGPDAFRDGVRSYVRAHEHRNATSADLFQALSRASGKDVWPIASTFLDQPGVPLVRAELTCEKGEKPVVKLSQSRFRARRASESERHDGVWKIPLCVAYEGAPGRAPACGLLEGPTAELALDSATCPRWVHPNFEERGYYRWALPAAQLGRLVGATRSLDLRSRIGLVSNAWGLVQSGDVPADTLLDLLGGLRGERHRLVIEQLTLALERVSAALVDDESRPAFRAFAGSILVPVAKELGWEPRSKDTDDQRLLRRSVLSALATLTDDPWMHAEAERRAALYMKSAKSVDGDIAAIALRVSTRRAGEKRFAELVGALDSAATAQDRMVLVGALGSFSDPALLRRSLELTLTGRLKMQDGFALFSAANGWPESRPHVLAWLRDRFAELKQRTPNLMMARLVGALGSICEPGARADAASFFEPALRDLEGADRSLRQALETADACIDLRAREGGRARKKFAGARGAR